MTEGWCLTSLHSEATMEDGNNWYVVYVMRGTERVKGVGEIHRALMLALLYAKLQQ